MGARGAAQPTANGLPARVRLLGVEVQVGSRRCRVPLKQKVKYVRPNPKKEGTEAWARYEKYQVAKTLGEALAKGACAGDIRHDFANDFLKMPGVDALAASQVPDAAASPSAASGGASPAAAGAGTAPADETLSVDAAVQRGVAGDLGGDAPPIGHVVSLGSRCVVARLLKDLMIRQYAGPFDWVYSSAEMVRHCIQEDFASFLNRRLLLPGTAVDYRGWGHKKYGPMLGRRVVFVHHDPKGRDQEYFKRAVERIRIVLKSPRRKLLVFAHPVTFRGEVALLQQPGSRGCSVGEVKQLFADLIRGGAKNFELVGVYLLMGKVSVACNTSPAEPKVRPLFDSGPGRERLHLLELHCVGDFTGLVFKKDADEQALRRLVAGCQGSRFKRKFELQPDPLPDQDDSSSKTREPKSLMQKGSSGPAKAGRPPQMGGLKSRPSAVASASASASQHKRPSGAAAAAASA